MDWGLQPQALSASHLEDGSLTELDALFTDNVAALAAAGAISMERVVQDGARAGRCRRCLIPPQGQPAGTPR